jgi:xanthosine utilization system XapX-like protein
MKTAVKILTALAAVVGAVYVVATYGDKIVQWAKNLLASCPCCKECDVVEEDFVTEEAPAEEAPVAEEAPAEEAPVEEPEVEIVVENNEPVAEETDFAE